MAPLCDVAWNVGKEPVLLRFFVFVGCFALDLFEEPLQFLDLWGKILKADPPWIVLVFFGEFFLNPRWFTVHKLMSHA